MIYRYHVVQEFNKGVYDYIIASDEGVKKGEQDSDESEEEQNETAADASDDDCKYSEYLHSASPDNLET